MGTSDDDRRRIHQDAMTAEVTGVDPRKSSEGDARAAQRRTIAEMVRQLVDGGFDPMLIIEMFLAGAAFLGDNHGVSRQQLANWITEVRMADGRQLVYVPR